jgi:hypothetical protein
MERYKRPLIDNLFSDFASKLTRFEEILALTVRIIAKDIRIQLKRNGECVVLDVLQRILSVKRKVNAAVNNQNPRLDATGECLEEIRMRLIELFRNEHGFFSTGEYLWKRANVDSAHVEIVRAILGAPAPDCTSVASVLVPKSIVAALKNILFSEDHCDVKFICDDGQVIPAHKAILAASSPYFAAAFQGPWAENGHSGQWKTSHASSILRVFLIFVYTGDIDATVISDKPIDMFSLASNTAVRPSRIWH